MTIKRKQTIAWALCGLLAIVMVFESIMIGHLVWALSFVLAMLCCEVFLRWLEWRS